MTIQWLLLGYNIPMTPSRARVYVWRKLKEYGAEYFRSGVAVLPHSPENLRRFQSLATRIREMEGEATLAEMSFLDKADEEELVERFRKQSQSDYQKLLQEARSLLTELEGQEPALQGEGRTRLTKLLRQIRRAQERDHFTGGFTEDLEQGWGELISTLRSTAGDFGKQLRDTLGSNRKNQ